MRVSLVILAPLIIISMNAAVPPAASADETLVESINLPGASVDQNVTYHPSKTEYEQARDGVLTRLRQGDATARVNPADGPWMRVVTTAKIGFEYRGVGSASGRKHVRQISSAEEALYIFEGTK
jgi:hypothetical protein